MPVYEFAYEIPPLPHFNVIFIQETRGLCLISSDSSDAFMHHSTREVPHTWQQIESLSALFGPLKSASPSREENEVGEEEGACCPLLFLSS